MVPLSTFAVGPIRDDILDRHRAFQAAAPHSLPKLVVEPRGQCAQDLHWVVRIVLLDRLRAHSSLAVHAHYLASPYPGIGASITR
jgi:hypothetical protein